MTHPTLSVIGTSITSLILIAGCASSPSRSAQEQQTHTSPSSTIASNQSQSHYLPAPSSSNHGEFIIGTEFSDESIPVYRTPINEYTITEIQAELEAMCDLDQLLVSAPENSELDGTTTASTIRHIDQVHNDRLKEIVDHIGWPTRDLVGLKATQAAYMVIQHSSNDIAFQNRCLELMVDLVAQGELPASYVALLTDRIRVFQDQPQVFGTQMEMAMNEFGVMTPTPTVPIEDPEHLDDRRKLMGMPSHLQFTHAIEIAYQASQVEPNSAFATVPTE